MKSLLYFCLGMVFLFLAKAKNMLRGYATPKAFDLDETHRCVDYDLAVVDDWLAHLARYTGRTDTIFGRRVLELGPGSDLGGGLYLLAQGAAQYTGIDVNPLAERAPAVFYEALFTRLASRFSDEVLSPVRRAWSGHQFGQGEALRYVVRADFDILAALGPSTVDLSFSQSAFECFDDFEESIRQLTAVSAPGALALHQIDLKTHSRWICDQDPNNIYRYPDALYRLFAYRGMPNRVRPAEFKAAFERAGWVDVVVYPRNTHPDPAQAAAGLLARYRRPEAEMQVLSMVLCARKP